MKRFIKKLMSYILAFTVLLCAGLVFSGCRKEDNAWRQHYEVSTFMANIKGEFLYKEENRINVPYKNKDYNPKDPTSEEYLTNPLNLPSNRVIIITEQTLLEEAFDSPPFVDFETRMVVIILFRQVGSFKASLADIKEKSGELEIIIESRSKGSAGPYLVNFAIEMDKIEVTTKKITFKNKKYYFWQ